MSGFKLNSVVFLAAIILVIVLQLVPPSSQLLFKKFNKFKFGANIDPTTGCCRKIIVTLRNNVYNTNSPKEGEYRLVRNKINGKNLWISADRNNAIWYFRDRNRNGGEWGIGLMNQIGSNRVELGTRGNLNTQCPSNRDTWQFLDDFGKWKFSSNQMNDVQIQCKQLRYPWDIFGVLGYKPVQQQSYFPPPSPPPVKNPCNCVGSNGGWSTAVVNHPNHNSPQISNPENHSPQNSNPQNHSPQNPNPTSINIPVQNGNNNYQPQGLTGIIDAKRFQGNLNGFKPGYGSIQYQTSASSNSNHQYEKSTSTQTIQNCAQKNLSQEKRNEIAEYFLTRLFYGILKGLRKSDLSLSKPGNNVPINYIPIEKDNGNSKPEIPGKPGSSFEAELLRSLEESFEEIEVPGVSEEQAKDLAKYFLPKFLEKVPDNFIPNIEIFYPLHIQPPQVYTSFIDVKAADDLANLGRSNVSLKENSKIGNGNQKNFRPAQEYTPALSSSPIYYTPQIESSKNREARLHLINGPPYSLIEKQPFNLIPDIEKLVVQDTDAIGQSTNQNWENLTEELIENTPENTTTENFLENDNSIVLPFWSDQNNSEESEKPKKNIQKNLSSSTPKFPFEGLAKQSKLVQFSDK